MSDLAKTLTDLQRTYGKGCVTRLGASDITSGVDVISTGSMALNKAIGVGGFPRGRITELFGGESAGKSTLALTAVANAQRAGGVAAYIDLEQAMDIGYAAALGVDTDNMLISQPGNAEEALEIAAALIKSAEISIIVVDSVAALVPKAEVDGEFGESHMGLMARMMSQAMRKLTTPLAETNTAMLFINQTREKIGVAYGDPTTTPGGKALKFYASLRMQIFAKERLKKGEEIYGVRSRVKIVKNKLAPPFKEAEFDIIFGQGISALGDLADCAISSGVINKTGAWYTVYDDRVNGRDAIVGILEDKPEIRERLMSDVAKAYGLAN